MEKNSRINGVKERSWTETRSQDQSINEFGDREVSAEQAPAPSRMIPLSDLVGRGDLGEIITAVESNERCLLSQVLPGGNQGERNSRFLPPEVWVRIEQSAAVGVTNKICQPIHSYLAYIQMLAKSNPASSPLSLRDLLGARTDAGQRRMAVANVLRDLFETVATRNESFARELVIAVLKEFVKIPEVDLVIEELSFEDIATLYSHLQLLPKACREKIEFHIEQTIANYQLSILQKAVERLDYALKSYLADAENDEGGDESDRLSELVKADANALRGNSGNIAMRETDFPGLECLFKAIGRSEEFHKLLSQFNEKKEEIARKRGADGRD